MLPWLLNGTLNEEERQSVLQHLTTCESCRRDLAETRLAFEMFDQHPPAEAIVALAWGETPPGIDPAFLEEHLAGCPRCAAELEMARTSRGLEEDERIVPLRPRTAPAPAAAPAQAPTGRTGWRGWKAAALAAGFAGVVAAAGWLQTAGRVQTLEERLAERPAAVAPVPVPPVAGGAGEEAAEAQRIAELERQLQQANEAMTAQQGQIDRLEQLAQARPATPAPKINTVVAQIQPTTDVVRGGETGPQRIPASSQATLLLGASHVETHREHAIEILDASGKVVWSTAGLALNADYGAYILTMEPGTLPKGSYTVRAYGLADGGKREPVETYAIRVE
jgi:anti-sigma factor RsiW